MGSRVLGWISSSNCGVTVITAQVAERLGQRVDGMARHGSVGQPGRTHQRGVRIVGQIQPRVDRYAVPAHRHAGTVDVAIRLGVGGVDHGVDVDVVRLGEDRELVGQRDVDVAVGGLGELGELGGLRAAHVPYAIRAVEVRTLVEIQHGLVERDCPRRAGGRQAADELRLTAQIAEDASGQDPLR